MTKKTAEREETYKELLVDHRRLQLLVEIQTAKLAEQDTSLKLVERLLRPLRKYLNPPTKVNVQHDPVSLRKEITRVLATYDKLYE